MKKKKSVKQKISEALEVEEIEEPIVPEIVEAEEKAIEISKPETKAIEVSTEGDIRRDYKHVRRNLRELIKTGNSAIEGILQVASEGDHPRAYEVAATLIKVVADTNKDLMSLHKQIKDIRSEEVKLTQNNTNNAIYVGSTSELQSLISGDRSRVKKLKNNEGKVD